jgi:hypothetical protein
MAHASSTANNEASTKYHTVNVCANLPKVEQNYPCNKAEDLPPADYWTTQIQSRDYRTLKKVQHIMANGPREL